MAGRQVGRSGSQHHSHLPQPTKDRTPGAQSLRMADATAVRCACGEKDIHLSLGKRERKTKKGGEENDGRTVEREHREDGREEVSPVRPMKQ